MAKLIYENPLDTRECIKDFIIDGEADVSFHDGAMRLKSVANPEEVDGIGFTMWCPMSFPSDIMIQWEFRPIKEPGLAVLHFAAKEKGDEINSYIISYFRRNEPEQKAFHTCDLQKNYDYNLVAQGADPLPDASADSAWYSITVVKKSGKIKFLINNLQILEFEDDGMAFGEILTGGCIGFGQQAELIAEYRNLRVTWI